MKEPLSDKIQLKRQIEGDSLQKIREDLHALISYFEQVLVDLKEGEVAKILHLLEESQQENLDSTSVIPDEKLVQAWSILYQLMNLVEENSSVQNRRKIENRVGADAIRGSWGETFEKWKKQGVSEDQIAALLPTLRVMPVLTAHPTEAKRISILELHRELYLLLVRKENIIWTMMEKDTIDDSIKAILERRSPTIYGDGEQSRDFTYVDDVVESIVRLLERPPEGAEGAAPYRILNVGNDQPVELEEFVALLERHLCRKAVRKLAPMQQGDVPATWADTRRLQALTGFAPRTPIDEGLRRMAEWLVAYDGAPPAPASAR